MMRSNRIFQSLGIDAIASMIRKTNDVQEGYGVQEGSGVISDGPEYNPKEDEVVVHKTVKVQTLSCLEGSGSCTKDSQQEEEELISICCNASRKGDGPTSRTNKEDPGT
ncbi:hypothetical protein D1007_18217 [Hordeum vulgare]|nr:hypothetical protein D1007_18217 [Hordeum vulgare]